MSLLDNIDLNSAEKAKDTSDTLPTAGTPVLESDVYPFFVKLAYLTKAASGAIGFACHFKSPDGQEYKETFWIASGDAKDNKTTYIRNGQEYPLPGFTHADHLCRLTAGTSLKTSNREIKLVNIYDRSLQKETPTEVEVYVDVIGKEIQLGIQKIEENKRIRVNDNWVTSNQKREYNQTDRIFNSEGKMIHEVLAGEDAKLKEKWLERNKGKSRGTYDPNKGVDAQETKAAATQMDSDTASLFD